MAARGFLYTLEHREFKVLLKLFSLVLPKADVLFSVLQKEKLRHRLLRQGFQLYNGNLGIESFKLYNGNLGIEIEISKHLDEVPSQEKRQRLDFISDEETSFRALMHQK
ncbi:hypothetical protein M8J76_002082 [Diaphorina citri]|nr:hypothetical protein M8J75_004314 [Diaphorina citri]KAI5716167.1 hypothetical protein M8J76_002082 [Diaphorina citri]